ncbi:hypothetical protein BDV19DRAFT_385947 [Aspergillus venezuelensis]
MRLHILFPLLIPALTPLVTAGATTANPSAPLNKDIDVDTDIDMNPAPIRIPAPGPPAPAPAPKPLATHNTTRYEPERGVTQAGIKYALNWWRKLEARLDPTVTIGPFECDKRFWCERGREVAVTWFNDSDEPRTMPYKNIREGIELVRDECHLLEGGKELVMGKLTYVDDWRIEVRKAAKKEKSAEGIDPLAH